ncbi:hypothetical protein ILUMI_10201, partial [Ignelater luminosus]
MEYCMKRKTRGESPEHDPYDEELSRIAAIDDTVEPPVKIGAGKRVILDQNSKAAPTDRTASPTSSCSSRSATVYTCVPSKKDINKPAARNRAKKSVAAEDAQTMQYQYLFKSESLELEEKGARTDHTIDVISNTPVICLNSERNACSSGVMEMQHESRAKSSVINNMPETTEIRELTRKRGEVNHKVTNFVKHVVPIYNTFKINPSLDDEVIIELQNRLDKLEIIYNEFEGIQLEIESLSPDDVLEGHYKERD